MINDMSYSVLNKKDSRGFTLAEVLLATVILVTAGVAIMDCFIVDSYFSSINKGRTAAMTDLSNMMEAIISTPFDDIPSMFPNNTKNGTGSHLYKNITGNYTLKNEYIKVTYPSIFTDPLEINVTLNWQDGKGHNQTTSLVTKKTK